ncbi:MAG TPA: hypothetical protein IAB68_00455 [Candidatus Aphodocola excrementigallinarum]|uniref:Transposase n=1 Tax=Candidatus Aphodocola excrementigallinarum TaxID=2840670 RepID=A0A9D1LHH7_9FIRM|nr:hypothetical protein [Candidatus Aphodocola excrementigallinarum]
MKVTDTEIYYINLKRVRQKYYNKEELTKLEKELLIMTTDNKEELRKISKGCREMESVAKKISKLSKEEEMQGIYLKEEQEAFIRDQIKAYAMKDGYNEGMEKGLKEGHKEGALNKQKEIAKNLLKEGIDIKIISTSTGLSKGEIEKLKSE